MRFIKNEAGVSEIMSIILLVAITVIIASIIAAYTYGVAGKAPKGKVLAARAERLSETEILVTYQGGPDHDKLSKLELISPDNIQRVAWVLKPGQTVPEPGDKNTITSTQSIGKAHILVVAYFYEGDEAQVILDTYV